MQDEVRKKLASDSLIKRLQKETSITLDDLLARRLFTDPPTEPCWHLPVGSWLLCYDDDISPKDRDRLRAGRKSSPELVKAAAALVLSVTGTTTPHQKSMIFDYTRYVEARHCEDEQTKRRSEGGKAAAVSNQPKVADNLKTVVKLWAELATKQPHERAEIIAQRMGRPVNTVRGWIRKAGLR